MDENNNYSKDNANQSTADAYEQINDTVTKPVSAFDMPTDNKVYVGEPEKTQPSAFEPQTEQKTQAAASYYNNSENNSSNYYTNSTVSNNTPVEPSTGFAVASLILGILSMVSCCCGLGALFSILGIIFGCIQPKDSYGRKPGMAIAGIITSVIGILFSVLAIGYIVIMSAATAGSTF